MIITAKTPGAARMQIIDVDGTNLTKKYTIESFDTDTGAALVVEIKSEYGKRQVRRTPMQFPRAKIVAIND